MDAMRLLHRIARPMMAGFWLYSGYDAAAHPDRTAARAEPVTRRLAPLLGLPVDPELHVRVTGACQVGAGILLASGRLPRLAAAVLALTTVPTTLAEHRFWAVEDPVEAREARVHFLKNLAMLGGLVNAVAAGRVSRRAGRG